MSDSFNVSAMVWPVMVDGAEVCRLVALNGLSVVYRDAGRSVVLDDKAGIADFIRQVLEAHPDEVADVLKVVTEAIWFAFSEPSPVKREAEPRAKREAKPKDELRDWLQATLVRSSGSMVRTVDVRWAWHEYFNATHKTGAYLTPHKFHARLRELGYTLDRASSDGGGTGTHIMGVFMQSGHATSDRPKKRKGVNRKAIKRTPPAVQLPISEDYAPLPFALVRQGSC